MTTLFVGNFEFEHRLASSSPRQLPHTVRRINHELATLWVAIAEDGDLIWTPATVEQGFFEELTSLGLPSVEPRNDERCPAEPVEVCPWGWTDEIRKWADQRNWTYVAPRQPVVREINSRRFSVQLESEWGCGLAGQRVIESVDELSATIRRMPTGSDRWVVKAEFGMSARERLLGRGTELSPQAINWVRKRLEPDRVLFFEPWIPPTHEAGLQYTIPQSGSPVFEGLTPLLTDRVGRYRGSRFALDERTERLWSIAVEVGTQVAQRVQQMGYFGPLGFDAARYRDQQGQSRVRPLQDINARYTMGRLSLGFRRVLNPGEIGTWLHVRWPATDQDAARIWIQNIQRQFPNGVRIIRTSPFVVDGQPVRHGTLVLTARSTDDLGQAETQLLEMEAAITPDRDSFR